jgi:divalent metal cation (Fe/Co/Zn/Cd) transporter
VHVLVPGTWTVARGHDLVEDIEAALAHEVPDLTLSTHVEPSEDPRSYDDFEAEFPVPPPGINPDRPAP